VAKLVTTEAATDDVPFVRSGRKIVIAPTPWLHQNPDLG
jgi:hypothetical protein